MNIILASKSPRRKELLERLGLDFEIVVSDVDENIEENQPENYAEELAFRKAMAVMDQMIEQDREKDYLVIGADTIVVSQEQILGKPKTKEEAVAMITMLQGNSHFVFTGVSVGVYKKQTKRIMQTSFVEGTQVTIFPMNPEEIQAYVDTGDCMDKAGAYGIQGVFGKYVEMIHGDYNNVVGLPIGRLNQVLKGLAKS